MDTQQVFTELLKETALNRYAALRALGHGHGQGQRRDAQTAGELFRDVLNEAQNLEALRRLTDQFDHAAAELEQQLS